MYLEIQLISLFPQVSISFSPRPGLVDEMSSNASGAHSSTKLKIRDFSISRRYNRLQVVIKLANYINANYNDTRM